MNVLSIIIICLLGAILVALAFVISVDAILSHFTFSRRSVAAKICKKVTSADYGRYLIDHDWWKNQKLTPLEITSFDGLKLRGQFIDNGGDKVAILVHGYGGCYQDLNPFADFFSKRGYSVLAVDCRGHGTSEGNMIGMGWLDRLDLKQWINLIVEKYPQCKIALFGQSMGASTVCMTLGEDLPKNVVCAVSDCAFDNVYREFYYVSKSSFRFLTKPLLNLLNSHLKRTKGYDIKSADAVKQLKKSHLPVLFIHGKDDDFVPVEMCYHLSESVPESRRDVLLVDGANHIMSYPTAPKTYLKTLSNFLGKYNM